MNKIKSNYSNLLANLIEKEKEFQNEIEKLHDFCFKFNKHINAKLLGSCKNSEELINLVEKRKISSRVLTSQFNFTRHRLGALPSFLDLDRPIILVSAGNFLSSAYVTVRFFTKFVHNTKIA